MPVGFLCILQTGIIDSDHKAVPELAPFLLTGCRVGTLAWIFVNPVLEGIDQCHVRPESDPKLHEFDQGTRSFALCVETSVFLCFIRRSQQLHAYGSHLREFCGQIDLAALVKVDMGALELVKCMTSFMQHRLHVPGSIG